MDRLKGMLFGAFVGDAFALAPHWIYDIEKLKLEFSNVNSYVSPSQNLFHNQKQIGDLTHYGDQSLLLLKSISTNKGYDNALFKTHWLHFMDRYDGYMDKASKTSLERLATSESGSSSDELGGFARTAPLIFYHFDDMGLRQVLHRHLKLTHDNEQLKAYSDYLTDVILELVIGKPLRETLILKADDYPSIQIMIDRILNRLDEETVLVVKDIGQSCQSQYALPATLYIALKYSNDFLKAMQKNILAGGDSAARGMVLGMLLGASLGFSKIPQDLVDGLRVKETLCQFVEHKRL